MPRDRRFQDRREPPDEDPIESSSRLPMEPWMKWTGMSLAAGVITWFRIPGHDRQNTLRAALIAMLVFAAVTIAIIGLVTFMSWAMPDRP